MTKNRPVSLYREVPSLATIYDQQDSSIDKLVIQVACLSDVVHVFPTKRA